VSELKHLIPTENILNECMSSHNRKIIPQDAECNITKLILRPEKALTSPFECIFIPDTVHLSQEWNFDSLTIHPSPATPSHLSQWLQQRFPCLHDVTYSILPTYKECTTDQWYPCVVEVELYV